VHRPAPPLSGAHYRERVSARRSPSALVALDAALAALPGSQQRPGQRAMVEAVAASLRRREHLLVQAGTGTGKSLGYLVPALVSNKRTVVATATKALQAQLVGTDLPRLVRALAPVLGREPSFALAKGRGNYLCLQQLHGGPGASEEPLELFDGPQSSLGATVVRLREWGEQTDTGDRDDVPFPVPDRAWRQVSVSARDCLGAGCPDREDCFSERARESAREADVVVANHALLALDLSGMQVLPEHELVVVDEAHELPAAVTEALTHELSAGEVRRAVAAAQPHVKEATQARLDDARDALEGLLGTLEPGWVRALEPGARDTLGLVETAVGAAIGELPRGADAPAEEAEAARVERLRTRLGEIVEAARELAAPTTDAAVYATPDGAATRLRVSPLQVGGALAERLLGGRAVVATSATLTFGGSFEHAAGQLGLDWSGGAPAGAPGSAAWRYLDVGSPFDHARQAQLWVARDLPDPGRFPIAWAEQVDAVLAELVVAAGGRTLALFSSTAAAARAAQAVRAVTDLPVLLQGEDAAGALVQRFRADARSCLFGTRSFWQGVDAPGSTCQLVVIDRLPFGYVDDPLSKARLAAAAGARRNGFLEVTLPPAAVLLAQGAGRLLRSSADRGVVAVLDPRLATAGYSGLLLATLPGFYRARSKDAVLASLRAIDAGADAVG